MLRRHPGGSGAGRLALLALVPLVVGAGLWLVNRDGRSPETTRVEATRSMVSPLLGEAVAGPWATPALPPAPVEATAGATDAAPPLAGSSTTDPSPPPARPAPAPAPAATGRADSVDGGVGGSTGTGASAGEPEAPSRGTGAATSTADLSGRATSAPSAPTADQTEPTTTTSPPTTQAPTTTTTAPARSAGRFRTPSAEAEVVPLTNRDRAAAGLGALTRNACLDAAASGFAEQMARAGVLAHNAGAGAAVAGCRSNPAWGDNVGTAAPCDTALLEREWMDSPSHRRNILTGAFQYVGVGAWTDEKGACWVQVLFSS